MTGLSGLIPTQDTLVHGLNKSGSPLTEGTFIPRFRQDSPI